MRFPAVRSGIRIPSLRTREIQLGHILSPPGLPLEQLCVQRSHCKLLYSCRVYFSLLYDMVDRTLLPLTLMTNRWV